MKTNIIIFLLLLCVNDIQSQDVITSEIYNDVFFLKYNNKKASGFLIKHNNETYLITAKHFVDTINKVVNKNGSKLTIEIFLDTVWKSVKGNVFFHTNKSIDIACIRQNYLRLDTMHFGVTMVGLTYGEDGYFLGFPFGQGIPVNEGLKNSHITPFVKKALLSAFNVDNGIEKLFLDGINNPGFSGGPIVFRNKNKNKSYKWNIVGVVSSYQLQNILIKTKSDTLIIPVNSGIIIGYGINKAIEIIKNNQNTP